MFNLFSNRLRNRLLNKLSHFIKVVKFFLEIVIYKLKVHYFLNDLRFKSALLKKSKKM
jgi:hypothetical protein